MLAGELKAADGDYVAAFAAYEREMRGFVEASQKMGLAAVDSMVERSAKKLAQRNKALKKRIVVKFIQ